MRRATCHVRDQECQEMLFMIIERFKPGRALEVYQRFRDRGRMARALRGQMSAAYGVSRDCRSD